MAPCLPRGVNVLVFGSLVFVGSFIFWLNQLFWGQKLIFTVTALHELNQTTTGILFEFVCDAAPTKTSKLLCSENSVLNLPD